MVGLVPAVSIDIKPGDARNTINLSSRGVTPVAILTTPGFDAASVDPFSVTLAGAPVRPHGRSGAAGALEDVDGDGDLDLVVQIETAELELTASDTEAVLTALTFDGVAIEARDVVTVIALPTGKEK